MMLSRVVERESQKNDRIAAATRRLQEKPDGWVQAVRYGYPIKEVARLNRTGWTYEFGTWVKYEPHDAYMRVRMYFWDHKKKSMRYTWAVGETRIKALRRAYSYKRSILKHGSFGAHFSITVRYGLYELAVS